MPEASMMTVFISVMRSIVAEPMVVIMIAMSKAVAIVSIAVVAMSEAVAVVPIAVVAMSKAVAVVTKFMSISMTVVEIMELSFVSIVSFSIA